MRGCRRRGSSEDAGRSDGHADGAAADVGAVELLDGAGALVLGAEAREGVAAGDARAGVDDELDAAERAVALAEDLEEQRLGDLGREAADVRLELGRLGAGGADRRRRVVEAERAARHARERLAGTRLERDRRGLRARELDEAVARRLPRDAVADEADVRDARHAVRRKRRLQARLGDVRVDVPDPQAALLQALLLEGLCRTLAARGTEHRRL